MTTDNNTTMVSRLNNNNNNSDSSSLTLKSNSDHQNKHQKLEPPMSSSSFSEYITRLVAGQLSSNNLTTNMTEPEKKPATTVLNYPSRLFASQLEVLPPPLSSSSSSSPQPPASPPPQFSSSTWPVGSKRPCRAPPIRKFAHPCHCGQSNSHHKFLPANNNNSSLGHLPPAAYSTLYLFDPHTKKCLPTSRNRDMLLKECHTHSINTFPMKHQNAPCVYDDLVCDARRNRCTCKPSLHLYYESNLSSFGCVPIGPTSSPDGQIKCRTGYVYNVISKDCQKIFDINELPPNYTAGVSATQFSFVTIVLIWILLLILIVTAKLRKLRTSNYRNSPTTDRRLNQGSDSFRHHRTDVSNFLHPFIEAVHGLHHSNHHRTNAESQTQNMDESGNYNDTDFFLSNGNSRINDIFNDNNFVGSQQSLNNPPPKFEEIYPSCPEEQQETIRPPSNEDLPSYDEAMKLQNTKPPDQSKE